MSGGRAELGIGAAWYEREHRYFGIPFPPLAERFDRLGEQLRSSPGCGPPRPGTGSASTGSTTSSRSAPASRARPPAAAGHHRRGRAAAHARAGRAVRRRVQQRHAGRAGGAVRELPADLRAVRRDPAQVRLSTTLPVCCGATRAEAARRVAALGEPGARMLRMGITGTPGDILGRIDELRAAGADTVATSTCTTSPTPSTSPCSAARSCPSSPDADDPSESHPRRAVNGQVPCNAWNLAEHVTR